MAFPGTFNINYYKGDTYEFSIYPKDSSGNTFDLVPYATDSATFTIAEQRGAAGASTSILGYAIISEDKTHIKCAITPSNALDLDATKTYFYDVQIQDPGSPYDFVYTLLTGTITIVEEVTLPE